MGSLGVLSRGSGTGTGPEATAGSVVGVVDGSVCRPSIFIGNEAPPTHYQICIYILVLLELYTGYSITTTLVKFTTDKK